MTPSRNREPGGREGGREEERLSLDAATLNQEREVKYKKGREFQEISVWLQESACIVITSWMKLHGNKHNPKYNT